MMQADGNDFSKRRREQRGVGVLFLDSVDHFFEAVDLRADVFTAGFRALDPQTQLKILFVADQNV